MTTTRNDFLFVGSPQGRAEIPIAYENITHTYSHNCLFGLGRSFYVRPNPEHYYQHHHLRPGH